MPFRPGRFGKPSYMETYDGVHPLGNMSQVTRILSQIDSGDPTAAEQLLPLVYAELRKLAAARLAQEQPGQTLQATALVHEAYLRLVDNSQTQAWHSRGHFFAAAAEAMRRILVENARRKRSLKRGGGLERAELDESRIAAPCPDEELLAGQRGPRQTRHDGSDRGGTGQAAVLFRPATAGSSGGTRCLASHGQPPVGLRQGLAAPRNPLGSELWGNRSR